MSRRILNILLLRHGLTDANADGVIQGHRPTPLNEIGREQARRLAGRLAAYSPKIERLISSDLPRAAQTAEPIAAACGLPIGFDEEWRERAFGEFEGTAAPQHDIWRLATGDSEPPGGESPQVFSLRIHNAITRLPLEHADVMTLAVVTHGGPCRIILRMLDDGRLPLAEGQTPPELLMIANCSIMHLIHEAGRWRLACLNDTAHLEDLRTLRDVG